MPILVVVYVACLKRPADNLILKKQKQVNI